MTPEGVRNRCVVLCFSIGQDRFTQVAHFCSRSLLICLILLAGCKCYRSRTASCRPCSPCLGASETCRGSPRFRSGNGFPVTPPSDADLGPEGFPESFTASIGSSHAKFFPLPTRPVFRVNAIGEQSRETSAKETDLNSSPSVPEVIPTPPPLPPGEFNDQTRTVTPRMWMYESSRWRSSTASDKAGRDDEPSPNVSDVSFAPSHQVSWLFQGPFSSAIAHTGEEPRVILPSQPPTATSARRTTGMQR